MPLPPALRDFPAVSVQFLALRTLCVLAVSASGDCRIDSLDGECFFAGPLAASPLPPLTSVTVARVREARNTVSLVVTALCRTIAIVDLDLVARAASLARPAHYRGYRRAEPESPPIGPRGGQSRGSGEVDAARRAGG